MLLVSLFKILTWQRRGYPLIFFPLTVYDKSPHFLLNQFCPYQALDNCWLIPKAASEEQQLRERLGAGDSDISYMIAGIYVR